LLTSPNNSVTPLRNITDARGQEVPVIDAIELAPRLKHYVLSQICPAERPALQQIFVYPADSNTLLFLGPSEQANLDFSKHVRHELEKALRRGLHFHDVVKDGVTSWTVEAHSRQLYCRGLCWEQVVSAPVPPREAAIVCLRKWVAERRPAALAISEAKR
jgi:hypothetical protein